MFIDIVTIKIATARIELKCFILSNILVCLRLSLKIIKYLTGTMKVQLKLGAKPKLLNTYLDNIENQSVILKHVLISSIPIIAPTL